MAEIKPTSPTPSPDAAKKSFAAPGSMQRRKRSGAASEYKKSLQEKQTLKRLYGLTEKQFKRYVKETLGKMGKVDDVSAELIRRLERRLDNVVFRLGFAKSRPHARQLVSHSYFLVNGKSVNIASYEVKKEDIVALKETKKKKPLFKELSEQLKKYQTPTWLLLDKSKLEGKTTGEPTLQEVAPPAEISQIFEFYSR